MPTAHSQRTKTGKRNLGEVLLIRLALSLACLSARAADTDWPQFRASHASGVAERFTVPTTWNVETGENVRWRVPVPGLAHSSPVVWVHPRQGDYLQTPTVVGKLLYGSTDYGLVTCFEARTGKIHYSERLKGHSQGFTASAVAGSLLPGLTQVARSQGPRANCHCRPRTEG